MDSNALTIILGTGLVSLLLGNFVRRQWLRRRREREQGLRAHREALARQQERQAPLAHNKAKRKRQVRDRQQHTGQG